MVGFALHTSLLLAAATSAVPFLVSYQAATLSDAQGNELGRIFMANYISVYEEGLPQDQRPQLRDLLERVEHRYGDSDSQGRAVLAREYLALASLDRFGRCDEIVLQLQHFTGLRYRVCSSPHQDVVRLVEDLTTPQRVYWLATTPDLEMQEKVNAVITSYMTKFDEAIGDPARAEELGAAMRSEIEAITEEASPGGSPYMVHEYEVGGGWEEVEVSDPAQEEEILLKLLAASSPDFSSRLARLLCLIRGLQDGAYPELSHFSFAPMVFSWVDLDSERLRLSCRPEDLKVQVVGGSFIRFLPVDEAIAESCCAGGKWDPPEVNLSFEKRVERLRSGRGW